MAKVIFKVDAIKAMKKARMPIIIKVKRLNELKFRLKIAKWFFMIGAWIVNAKLELKEDNDE